MKPNASLNFDSPVTNLETLVIGRCRRAPKPPILVRITAVRACIPNASLPASHAQ